MMSCRFIRHDTPHPGGILATPEMTRQEILDALCFGDFLAHKIRVDQAIKAGRIPHYRDKRQRN